MLEQIIDLHVFLCTCSLSIQLLLCVNIIVNKGLTTSIIKYAFGPIISPCNASYILPYWDIPGMIVWTIISICNASYILPYIDITGITVWTIISAVTLTKFYQEFIINSWFYHIDIPGIINLCFYHILAMHIII